MKKEEEHATTHYYFRINCLKGTHSSTQIILNLARDN